MKLLFDIETDGLDATVVWCLVIQDVDTNQVWEYSPNEIEDGVKLLNKAEMLSGHNIIGFDIPVLEKLTSFKLGSQKIIDTLVLSRLFNPVREGGHSLGMWGQRLGLAKIEFDQFECYSKEMLIYCKRDVDLNVQVYHALRNESAGFDPKSIEIETESARILKSQEAYGFYFDEFKAEMLLAVMREKMSETKQG
jgi:DNA polymerase-1